jgi:hypothetical protein
MPYLLRPANCPVCMSPLPFGYAQAKVSRLSPRARLVRGLGLAFTIVLLAALLVAVALFVPDYLDETAQHVGSRRSRRMNAGLLVLIGLAIFVVPALVCRWLTSSWPRLARIRCPGCDWSGTVSWQTISGEMDERPLLYESHIEGIPELDDPLEGRAARLHRRRLRRSREEEEQQSPNPDFDFRGHQDGAPPE